MLFAFKYKLMQYLGKPVSWLLIIDSPLNVFLKMTLSEGYQQNIQALFSRNRHTIFMIPQTNRSTTQNWWNLHVWGNRSSHRGKSHNILWHLFLSPEEYFIMQICSGCKGSLTLVLLVANLANAICCTKAEKWPKHGHSSECTQWELSNEYQHDRV